MDSLFKFPYVFRIAQNVVKKRQIWVFGTDRAKLAEKPKNRLINRTFFEFRCGNFLSRNQCLGMIKTT